MKRSSRTHRFSQSAQGAPHHVDFRSEGPLPHPASPFPTVFSVPGREGPHNMQEEGPSPQSTPPHARRSYRPLFRRLVPTTMTGGCSHSCVPHTTATSTTATSTTTTATEVDASTGPLGRSLLLACAHQYCLRVRSEQMNVLCLGSKR